jgi:hypothetical protein
MSLLPARLHLRGLCAPRMPRMRRKRAYRRSPLSRVRGADPSRSRRPNTTGSAWLSQGDTQYSEWVVVIRVEAGPTKFGAEDAPGDAGAVGAAGSNRKKTLHIGSFGAQTVRKPLKVVFGPGSVGGYGGKIDPRNTPTPVDGKGGRTSPFPQIERSRYGHLQHRLGDE